VREFDERHHETALRVSSCDARPLPRRRRPSLRGACGCALLQSSSATGKYALELHGDSPAPYFLQPTTNLLKRPHAVTWHLSLRTTCTSRAPDPSRRAGICGGRASIHGHAVRRRGAPACDPSQHLEIDKEPHKVLAQGGPPRVVGFSRVDEVEAHARDQLGTLHVAGVRLETIHGGISGGDARGCEVLRVDDGGRRPVSRAGYDGIRGTESVDSMDVRVADVSIAIEMPVRVGWFLAPEFADDLIEPRFLAVGGSLGRVQCAVHILCEICRAPKGDGLRCWGLGLGLHSQECLCGEDGAGYKKRGRECNGIRCWIPVLCTVPCLVTSSSMRPSATAHLCIDGDENDCCRVSTDMDSTVADAAWAHADVQDANSLGEEPTMMMCGQRLHLCEMPPHSTPALRTSRSSRVACLPSFGDASFSLKQEP
jgi:hypothetical protein